MLLRVYSNSLNHPDIAGCYNNLGRTYSAVGGYDRAIVCYDEALKIQQKIYYGIAYHPDIATTYNNFGITYSAKRESVCH